MNLINALVQALQRAAEYNRNDQIAPVALLWTDKERQWLSLMPELRKRLPLLTYGDYDPTQRTGPAYWLRCMIARALPADQLPTDVVPIIYLPGASKQEMRTIEESPKALKPLAELQYRGVLWTQRNGRDWTIAAFLQSKDGGLDIPVSADNATKEALIRALPVLANEPLLHLQKEAPLRAAYLDGLPNPDEVRRLLLWMNDPKAIQAQMDAASWTAFCNLCQRIYDFHPQKDGPMTAALKLGQNQHNWPVVWQRYVEAPHAYPNLAHLLRKARPPSQPTLFERPQPYWPQDNDAAEATLRDGLTALYNRLPQETRAALQSLEADHGQRREWVWAKQGAAPLAVALASLIHLAQQTQQSLGGGTVQQIAEAYTSWGWQVDADVIAALQSVNRNEDVVAVSAAIRPLYQPWLEQGAQAIQKAMQHSSMTNSKQVTLKPAAGACLLFCDALRFDVGQRLASLLIAQGLTCYTDWRFAALPTVTPTAKPAMSPVMQRMVGQGRTDLTPITRESGSVVTAPVLRKLLVDAGYQVLEGHELGEPSGFAWTELGAIDQYGHQHGLKIALRLEEEVQLLAERITALLNHGWRQVMITTDHGWLLLPGKLPKVDLPQHLTYKRKGRCAVLKEGIQTDQQSVPWYWDKDVRIAIASGIGCYEDGKVYEHGGISPQECVIPLLTVTSTAITTQAVMIEDIRWRRQCCTIQLKGITPGIVVDIRQQPGNPATSLLSEPKAPEGDGVVSLLLADEDLAGTTAIIVVLADNGLIQAQQSTVIGG